MPGSEGIKILLGTAERPETLEQCVEAALNTALDFIPMGKVFKQGAALCGFSLKQVLKQKLREIIKKKADKAVKGANRAEHQATLPRSGLILQTVGAASRSEMFARQLNLKINNLPTRQVLNSSDDTVEVFVSRFRKSSIRSQLPGEFLNMTLEEAIIRL
ncbi:MAG: hypothetical protein ROO73_00995 [Roseivirga sp.]